MQSLKFLAQTVLLTGASRGLTSALEALEGTGVMGKLISAVCDPWRDLAKRAAELDRSDMYTLRRIVPANRGVEWA